jgi:hypothetical protein
MRTTFPHLALALAALLAFPLLAGETKGKAAEKSAAPAAEAAMKIFIDPATGQVVGPKSSPAEAGSVSATTAAGSAQPLRVEKVTTKAGGKKVNLQGRFMMEMAATAGSDGRVVQSCDATHDAAGNGAAPAKEHHHDR